MELLMRNLHIDPFPVKAFSPLISVPVQPQLWGTPHNPYGALGWNLNPTQLQWEGDPRKELFYFWLFFSCFSVQGQGRSCGAPLTPRLCWLGQNRALPQARALPPQPPHSSRGLQLQLFLQL